MLDNDEAKMMASLPERGLCSLFQLSGSSVWFFNLVFPGYHVYSPICCFYRTFQKILPTPRL